MALQTVQSFHCYSEKQMGLGTQPRTAGVLAEPCPWICVGRLSATAVHVLIFLMLPALHAVCYLAVPEIFSQSRHMSYVLNGQLCVDRFWQRLLLQMITRLSLECLVI